MTGVELGSLEEWLQRGGEDEPMPSLASTFFPIYRLEKITVDESVEGIPSVREALAARLGVDPAVNPPDSFLTVRQFITDPAGR